MQLCLHNVLVVVPIVADIATFLCFFFSFLFFLVFFFFFFDTQAPGTHLFRCKACLDARAEWTFGCHGNKPELCDGCLRLYLQSSIDANDSREICCPFGDKCKEVTLALQDVSTVDEEFGEKYRAKLAKSAMNSNADLLNYDPSFLLWA